MKDETCELCGYRGRPATTEIHHIVPKELTEQAGMRESQSVRLCCNCHREVHVWYKAKVSDVVYSARTKEFRAKSWLEMVKEYQSAFNSFVKYNKRREEALPPSQWKATIRWLLDYSRRLLIYLPHFK